MRLLNVVVVVILGTATTLADDRLHFHNLNRTNTIVKRRFGDGGGLGSAAAASSPPLTGCGACKTREEIRTRNLNLIKVEMLKRMGFDSAPNVTGKTLPPVPSHFLAKVDADLIGMQGDEPEYKTGYTVMEEEDDFHVRTQEVLAFAQPHPRLRHNALRGYNILHFTFSESLTKYHVSNATLFVYVEGVGGAKQPRKDLLIEIFKVYRLPDHSDVTGILRMVTKKILQPAGKGDWIRLDLTITVSEWFKDPEENYGFVVNASTDDGRRVAIIDSQRDKMPYVVISTMEAKRRTRRNVGLNCDDKMNEPLCCRYPLMIDFVEFGWDFIIAPKRYDAHYCSGECPYVTLQKYAHTHIKTMASPNSAQPCCAPRKMSSISMLYFDPQLNVVYGSLPGMVVDRCGCT